MIVALESRFRPVLKILTSNTILRRFGGVIYLGGDEYLARGTFAYDGINGITLSSIEFETGPFNWVCYSVAEISNKKECESRIGEMVDLDSIKADFAEEMYNSIGGKGESRD